MYYYVTGEVVLSRDNLTQMLQRPTGYIRARAVLLHELGHLLGLNHVQDRNELMDPVLSGLTGYGPGDRAGLARLGHGPCITDPN
jgi:predicted Zn-dependent protease